MLKKRISECIFKLIHRYNEHDLSVYAAQATLFMIISAVPFMMIMLSAAQFAIPFSHSDIVEAVSSVLPYVEYTMVERVVNEIFTYQPVSVLSVTALTLIWSSSRGVAALMSGLERVSDADNRRSWLVRRMFAFLYTIIFVVGILVTLVLLVMGNSIIKALRLHFPHIMWIVERFMFLRYLIPALLLTIIFWLGYKFMPGKRKKGYTDLPGAVFSTIGWIGFSYLFGIYVTHFSNYSYVYGSLSVIVLLMLWTYVCMNIFLIGAELNKIGFK